MERIEKLSNGNTIKYNCLDNGTCYHADTPERVIRILEGARQSGERIRLFYGDVKTGKCWNEENDVVGRVGRSTGSIKVPLLIANCRSIGGGAILDHCIVKIINKGSVLYQHPTFNHGGTFFSTKSDIPEYKERVELDGKIIARFKKACQAQRYVNFMIGARFSR